MAEPCFNALSDGRRPCRGARRSYRGGDRAADPAIENALESVPDFAFDLSKTLVESVCKTVLARPRPRQIRNGTARGSCERRPTGSALLPRDHPDRQRRATRSRRRSAGCSRPSKGLCELRNSYGLASHGRDGFSARLDLRQATLAAQAADTIVSFLYRIHRDALMQAPGARVYYEDHADFNEAFDRDNEVISAGRAGTAAEPVLFHADREAYKALERLHRRT